MIGLEWCDGYLEERKVRGGGYDGLICMLFGRCELQVEATP